MALDPGGDLGGVLRVKQTNVAQLLRKRNVVGVGVGYKVTAAGPTDELAVIVNVSHKVPLAELSANDLIPRRLDDARTDVVETGHFRAFEGFRERQRPVPPGVSLGHRDVTSGTCGCLVRRGDEMFILSNNHVLAAANNARPGDPIWQPGPFDDGRSDDQVAELADFIPLDFGDGEAEPAGCRSVGPLGSLLDMILGRKKVPTRSTMPGQNQVDAALARPLDPTWFTPEIINIGRPTGVADIGLGDAVKKSGRTTGYTEGRIVQLDVTTSVMYDGRAAVFRGQLMADGMSAPGDSGSAVLDMQNAVIGLLFAGSERATLINPIGPILEALRVDLVT